MSDRGDDRTQRILIGVGLVALALFILLSLVPIHRLGNGVQELFPSGNAVGPVGAALSGTLVGVFGLSAVLIPILPFLWGAWSFAALERGATARWTLWLAAALALVPPLLASFAYAAGGDPSGLAGAYGDRSGTALVAVLGWAGSALLLIVALVAATLLTLGTGPFRALARSLVAARSGGEATVRAAGRLARWGRLAAQRAGDVWAEFAGAWDRLTARLRGRHVPEPFPGEPAPGGEPPGAPVAGESAGDGRAGETKRRFRGEKRRVLDVPLSPDLPHIELLSPPPKQQYSVSESALDRLGETLVETLRTFRVDCEIGGRTTGPVVTQFEVVPASGVKVGKIAALADDLALALKAPSIRIIAPIPGKGAVGVEVPNPKRKIVYLREILESPAYRGSRAELPLALGEDVTGRSDIADLAKMPHLLIAGVTGSGKSVCINAIISSLIYRYTPERLRLLLIDPKMVELGGYNVLPHLRHPVVTDNDDAATVLKWLVYEMERRYEWLSLNGSRNLREFNQRIARGLPIRRPDAEGGEVVESPEPEPYIVLVIDELADLMMTVQSEVERPLAYLAQKARATGIHLVVATQRPSVNVITGLIKANFPCRIAFRVASKVDSRTIIDQNGAETLLGNGDMLFMPPGQSEPVRIQGTFVSTDDTERLMDWYVAKADQQVEPAPSSTEEDILEAVHLRQLEEAEAEVVDEVLEDRDPLFRRAAETVIQQQQGSTSLLQRRLKIGYGRAARIVDQLEHAGIVGPPEGSKPRDVLITLSDLEKICSAGSN